MEIMNISDYVVPIYFEGEFNGTGFLVGESLITAAHVVVSVESENYFLFRGNKIIIGPENNLIFDYPHKERKQGKDNLYWDLAVFSLNDIFSPLELYSPQMKEKCLYHGYTDSTLEMNTYTDIVLDNNAYYYPPEYKSKPIRITNCYISVIGKCTHGNSGGPLFQGTRVVGMLSGGQQWHNLSWDRIIKADHIFKRIQEEKEKL